jgi:uncharacterized repeat protein (TIGR01451 family)
VWEDLDHDGIQDAGEPGIPGVTVMLQTPTGTLTTTTDANGFYTFTDLISGVPYTMSFTRPDGYEPTIQSGNVNDVANSDADPITGIVPAVVLTPGENNPNIDAGYWRPASFGNYVWHDIDHDGVQEDGEPAIAGVVVTLHTPTGTITTTTSVTGYCRFDDLISGYPYVIEFGEAPGYQRTISNGGVNDATNSDADPSTGRTPGVVLSPGEHNPNIDAGYWQPAGLGDYVWLDVDHDGVQDPTETGVKDVVVTLYENGVPIRTTTTSATGYYEFVGLTPSAVYSVNFGLPSGYAWTVQSGDINNPSNSDANIVSGSTPTITFAPNEFNSNLDAGLWKPTDIEVVKTNLNPGVVKAGQTIGYQIVVKNTGTTLAKGVIITDPIPSGTTYVNGSASPTAVFNGSSLTWNIDELAPGAAVTVTFQVMVNANLSSGTVITNVAIVNSDGREIVLNSNEVQNPFQPTVVALDLFTAKLTDNGVLVKWRTSLERNTLGFNVWRSMTGNRADAVKVSTELIAAKGATGGTYEFIDLQGAASAAYWLEEIELNGKSNEYGPALVAAPGLASETQANTTGIVVGGVQVRTQVVPVAPSVAQPQANTQSVVSGNAIKIESLQSAASGQPSVASNPLSSLSAAQSKANNAATVSQPQPAGSSVQQNAANNQQPKANSQSAEVLTGKASEAEKIESEQPIGVAVESQNAVGVARGANEPSAISVPKATNDERRTSNVNTSPTNHGAMLFGVALGLAALAIAGGVGLAIRRRKKSE